MLLGLFNLTVTGIGFLYPRLRRLELELADHTPGPSVPAEVAAASVPTTAS
jgi:hypothetical protein